MRLDHVALATRDCAAALTALVGDLGGTELAGGEFSAGFRSMQVMLGDETAGMKVELLEPHAVEHDDFLERFLAGHGDGPHHLTFKVEDLAASLERVQAAGYTPVGIDLSDPGWREAFLLPREAHGTVVQLAESNDARKSPAEEFRHARDHGVEGTPRWWPQPPPTSPDRSYLRRVVMTTQDVPATVEFFAGLLDGDAWGRSPAGERAWVELAWPAGGRIRVEEHSDAAPGIDRLEVEGPGPRRDLEVAGTRVAVTPLA